LQRNVRVVRGCIHECPKSLDQNQGSRLGGDSGRFLCQVRHARGE
jgi:hypothetical protein